MTYFYKDFDKLVIGLLAIVLLNSSILIDTMAKASIKEDLILFEESSNNIYPLRGEIWYGDASWYGPRFHGRRTSSGEKFNKNELTAAHRTLPFNTRVLVTNLKNNKTVIVRINDRGPFIDNRIIDLSEEAAKKIDVRKEGIAYIKLQVLTPLLENQRMGEVEEKS